MTSDNTLPSTAALRGTAAGERKIAINADTTPWYVYAGILALALAAPFVFPAYTTQIAVLWLMILFAVTWDIAGGQMGRSEEHTSELQSLMRISYAVFCLKKKKKNKNVT